MSQLNSLPKFSIPLEVGEMTSKDWYFFWNGLYTGLPPALPIVVNLSASPAIYSMPVKGILMVSGGTISSITFSRDGINSYPTGQTAGQISGNQSDQFTFTYTVKPTITFVPT